MATDLKKLWFDAITCGNTSTLSRLLFATPTPQAGQQRLAWTFPETVEYPESIKDKALERCGQVEANSLQALPLAMLMWFNDMESKNRSDVIKTMLSATNPAIINQTWGQGNTILHLAALFEKEDLIKWILSKSPDLSIRNDLSCTPADLASNAAIKELLTAKQSIPERAAFESTEAVSKATVEEEMLKELGIDENDCEAEDLKKKILFETSSSRSPSAVKPISLPVSPVKPGTSDRHPPIFETTRSLPGSPVKPFAPIKAPFELRGKSLVSSSPFLSKVAPSPKKSTTVATLETIQESEVLTKVIPRVTITEQVQAAPVEIAVFPELVKEALVEDVIPKKAEHSARVMDGLDCDLAKVRPDLKELPPAPTPPPLESLPLPPAEPDFMTMDDFEFNLPKSAPTKVKTTSVQQQEEFVDYETEFKKHMKQPVMVLIDHDDKSGSQKRNVHFGNSWRGELEKTRKFLTTAATESLGRPAISVNTFVPPSKEPKQQTQLGKLMINVISMRGLVMNLSRDPTSSYTFCNIKIGNNAVMTRSIPCCPQNMYTEIPVHEEVAFPTNGNAELEIELVMRLEFEKPEKFDAKKLFRRDSMRSLFDKTSPKKNILKTDASCEVIERTICKIKMRLTDVLDKCQDFALDRKWSWQVIEQEKDQDQIFGETRFERSLSRASSVSSKIFNGLRKSNKAPVESTVQFDVSEAGTLHMQMFYVGNLANEVEQKMIPNRISEAIEYLDRKKWHETFWISGHLSQIGGDVKHWRRRFYKVYGAKMDAFHEFTMEYRTSIDLRQVLSLRALPVELDGESFATKNSFRLHFKHGEIIDFYAESKEECDKWVSVLQKICNDMPDTPEWLGDDFSHEATDKSKASKRSPKKMSFDANSFSSALAEGAAEDEEFKPYDKRYKTPSAKVSRSSLLLKKKEIPAFDTDDSYIFSQAAPETSVKSSASFVGVFGTQKPRSVKFN